MPAAYDKYDYRSYWKHRDYEHKSEVIVIKELLKKVPIANQILEIGAGYGRLVPYYMHRAKKVTLTDPSAKNLMQARKSFDSKKFKFIHAKAENLNKKVKKGSVDLVIIVRVLHHITDLDEMFAQVDRILAPRGFLILEFANKRHFKAIVSNFFKGDLTFGFDIFPKEVGKKKKKVLPFLNYHPDVVIKKLEEQGFTITQKRSVSNIRSQLLKDKLPFDFLLNLEQFLQSALSYINFGPSIFLLARKRG
jgi:ubiquinone/menaquinone biosynthesis C-methylase UbiE